MRRLPERRPPLPTWCGGGERSGKRVFAERGASELKDNEKTVDIVILQKLLVVKIGTREERIIYEKRKLYETFLKEKQQGVSTGPVD